MDAWSAPPLQPHLSHQTPLDSERLSQSNRHLYCAHGCRLKQTYLYRTSYKRTRGARSYQEEANCVYSCFLVCFPPFLSERRFLRPSSNVKMPDPPFPLEYKQLSLDFSHQLIGVKFLFHAACTLCLLALSVVAFLDGIVRVVFWSCNSAVCLATDSLQVKYSKR